MSKHEQQLKDAFINDLKAPDQYDELAKKLEIKRSPKHTHYMKKPFFTKPRLIVAMSSFLLLIAGFIAFSLVSVNAGVPVYKGMEVESVTQVSSAYALEEVSEPFIDEIESGLVPETTEGISYYAEQGETILVKVNMENPNNHIILSFTLNGFMYQDLDFEEGPELNGIIQIIVEFRVANASGIQNITIDAIKYIDSDDNNAIKDAIFDADRTIQVGILYDDIPEILEVSETIAATSFTLDFTLTDPSSLSVDTAFLYVFDGTNIMYTQPLSIGVNSFVVSDLMMGHTYEYAITTLFDPLDGVGERLFVLNQGILQTLHGVTPSVTSTQEGVSSTLVTLEGVSITTVSLYLNDTLISNITETNNAYVLEDLLSNTTYELRTTYTYTFNGTPLTQTSVETFTTDAKDIPEVKVLSAVSFGNLVFSTFRVTDVDDTITDLEVRLYKDGDLVQTLDNVTLTPQVANPGTFNASVNLTYSGIGDYLIVVVYTYDLNEGNPLVTVDSLDINADHTLRYEVTREIPELTLNGDSTVTIEVFSTYTELGAVFNDSKDGTGNALISGDTVNTNIVGTYTVLYNYTDTDNNRATQLSRIVNVVDTTAPVITLNGNAEITIEAGSTYNELGAAVTDNYDSDNVAVVGGDTVDASSVGIYIITYNFTDVNGNAATEVTRTVTVVDTTAPLITIDGGNTMTLEYLDTFVEPLVTVTDNLDDTRTINGVGTVDTSTLGTYTLTYNTTDTVGNVADEVTLTVTVVDTTAPVITLNGDAEITLQAGANYTELGAVVTDNYDADDVAVITGDTVDTSTLGTYEVTYNFTDSNNNVAIQVTRTVTVIDTTAPVITLTGDVDITIQAGSIYTDQGATFSDNLDATGTITVAGDTVDTSVLGDYIITFDAVDTEGNNATQVTRTVTVIDTIAPVITLTGDADITIQAGSVYTDAGAIFSDNLDTTGTITVVGDTIDTSVLGENTITYNATDSEGNVAIEVTRTVTVIDTTAPVITLNGDATVNIEVGSTYSELGAVVTDNYDADDVAVIGGDTVDTSTLGTYAVTYNFTDSNNNAAVEVTRTVNVVDTTPPVITLNGDATVNIEVGSAYTELGAIVTDNYDADDVALIDGDIVDTSILDTYEVTYFFTDSSNNDAIVVTRTVNVVDTTAPVIVVTGGNTFTLEAGSLFIPPVVTLTDNYDDDLIITLEGNFNTTINPLVPGTYTITYNKDDSSGNQAAEVIVTVTITDTTIPVITLEGSSNITIQAGSTYEDLGVTISDNALVIGDATVSNTVDTSVLGTYTITYDYTDASGNAAAQVSRTVNVIDTTAPVITLNGDDEISIQAGSVYTDAGATFSDNLDTTGTITAAGDTVNTSVLGDYTVTFDAVDTEGNNAIQVTRTVTVVDTTAPVIVITGGNTLDVELDGTFTEPAVTLTDNYDADFDLTTTGTLSATIDTSILDAVYTITYSGTDSLGNVADPVILTITIVDTTAPTADPISTKTYEVNSTPIDFTTLITNASDNATTTNNLVITETNNVDFDTVGQYEAVITVTDEKGNDYLQTVTVNIVDTTAPVIVITGGNTITLDYLETFVEPEVTLTDNYDVDTSLKGLGNLSALIDNTNVGGNYTMTYDAQDLNGNNAVTVILTIQIRDISAPTFDTIVDETIQAGTANIDWTTRMVNVADIYDDAVTNTITLTEVTDNVNYNVLGTYTVTVKATDTSGNETSQTFNVTVEDTTAPVIVITGGNSIDVEQNSVFNEPTVTLTDNYDANANLTGTGSLSATIDTSVLGAIYTITYNGTDSLGNVATPVTLTITIVDTTAPVMTNVSLISNTNSFTITTNEQIDSINIDGAGFTSITATTSHTLTSLSDGNHTINLRDPLGNVSSTYTILIDTTQPVLSSRTTNAYQSVDDYDFNVGINQYLGYSGGLGSDFAVVGSTHNKVYVYDLTKTASDQYYETVITSVSDSRYTTVFGDYIIISNERHSSSAGVVIMYKLTRDINNNITGVTSVFTQNGNTSAGYGKSTAVYNDYLIVGAWSEKRVYVYEFTYTNGDITGIQQLFYLETQDTVSLYGFEVDIYGNYIAVGTASNKVYLYEITDFSTPTYTETMISTPVGSNFFGRSLTLDNYKLVVGAYFSNLNGNNSGSAYIFNDVRSLTTSSGSIVHDAELLGHNAGENFGYSVKLYGDILLIGATEEYSFQGGKVYIYDLSLSSSHDNYESAIDSSEAGTAISSEGLFGNFVSYNGTYVLVGAGYNHLYGNFDNGSAHLFRKQPGFVFTVNETNVDTQTLTIDAVSTAISNNLFYNTEGTYQFIVTDTAGNTTTLNYIYDVTAPVITLNGASSITLTVGDPYTESGANVTDNIYPNDVAVITGTVNTSVAGTYTINYDYTDGSGNDAVRVTRTVIVQSAPGTQNNPNQISTTQEFIDYFNSDRQLLNNFNKEYFILMNNLDFQNAQLPELELRGHLDGQNYTISNAQTFSNSSDNYVGFFKYMQSASLKNITFNNITSNNSTAYTSTRKAGLLFGAIDASSGTNVIDNITISNSNLIYNSTLRGEVGLIAGLIKNADISNITLSNNNLEYRSSYTAQEHWYVGFMFGSNAGVVTMSNITGSGNKLYQSQGNNSINAPGVIIGYALAREVFNSYVTLSNLNLSVNIYLKTTGSRSRWWFGYYGDSNATSSLVSSNVSITTTILNITSY